MGVLQNFTYFFTSFAFFAPQKNEMACRGLRYLITFGAGKHYLGDSCGSARLGKTSPASYPAREENSPWGSAQKDAV
jgi:hypothetical protein